MLLTTCGLLCQRVLLLKMTLGPNSWQFVELLAVVKGLSFMSLVCYQIVTVLCTKGIARLYASDYQGQEYNKRFFVEGEFPGIMSALHLGHRVEQGIECLTDSILIEIDFVKYRDLLFSHDDLMQYQIHYLEKNWLLDKDKREILLVQKDATARYLHFLEQSPELTDRIPQYHLASHLGVSATQLSRIRKSLGKI